MTPKQAEEIVMADGWRLKRIEGSHYHYVHPTKPGLVTIPFHKRPKDLLKKTVSSIMKQAGLK
ncbi:type II toxin-antitoxin system HicA family toxin [Selenomonas caprae]|uniref:Type II toxin-antitoxin system HicA family toxin n=1 Tax=Selenomonas caprae TaxID=2606905 RepID=A0A5D6WPG2_9FIRM|nr:type II toxin-antitoxin system HicA family toxin [Selenomonas caprae]TYZ29837.1 type II toxin-antitoxin system HicA family toxin [Selenomonas caprae]